MTAYISASFEKDQLATSSQVRVITLNRDDGSVPPEPSTSYFPTTPDELQDFIVLEYLGTTVGETFKRIATTSDIDGLSRLTLNTLEDTAADFISAGVAAGDGIDITLNDSELWLSSEYPSGNPYTFTVANVVSATQLTITSVFPGFQNNLTWSIAARGISGTNGVTLRNGDPAVNTEFKINRANLYFTTAVAANNYVTSAKAGIQALVNEAIGDGLVDETITKSPSV